MADQPKGKTRRIPTRRMVAETALQVARNVLAQHRNDSEAALADLADQTHRLRQRNRELRESLPKDGDVVLTGDQVKLWEAVQKIRDATPERIQGLQQQVEDLQRKLGAREETDLLMAAHEATKFPRAVLADLKRARGLKVEVRDEQVKVQKDGKEVTETRQVVYITEPGEGKAPMEFAAYIEARAPEYKDRLPKDEEPKEEAERGGETTRRRSFQAKQQAEGGQEPDKQGIDALVEKNAAAARAPNPLRPAAKTA